MSTSTEFHKKKLRNCARVRDLDKDGFVTLHDYEQIVKRFEEFSAPPEHIEATKNFFKVLTDAMGLTDHSKKLTYDQFADAYITNLGALAKYVIPYSKSCFNAIDTNRKGVISIDEWEVIMKGLGFDTAHSKVTFDAMDTNGKGTVTCDEFAEYHYEFFCTDQNTLNSAILMGPIA